MAGLRFTLGYNRRIKSRTLLNQLVAGKKAYAKNIKCFYLINPQPVLASQSMAAFSVPKRLFRKASDRNLLKRRMKEAYRLARPDFDRELSKSGIQCALLFVYTGKEKISFSEFREIINQLIYRILKDGTKP